MRLLITRLALLWAAQACVAAPGMAADPAPALSLRPAAGVSARIEKQGKDFVLIQPQGQRAPLLSEDDVPGGDPSFEQADYDYDGHPDFSYGVRAGMVNIEQTIWLYHVDQNAYRVLELPKSVMARQNCEGFWDIERLVDRHAIKSQCRGGPRWFYDVLQIDPDRSVWLSGQNREPQASAAWPAFTKPLRDVTYDRQGKVLSETVPPSSESGEDTGWVVPVQKLALFSAPNDQATTKGYLIKGDKTAMLAFQGEDWMKIAYIGKQGLIERWVRLQDAYGKPR